jgi:3' exoribonuclease, RNase T-like
VSIKYFYDTEFMEDGKTIELLSIGVVCEDGREYYAVVRDADRSHANEWVKAFVLPHLGGPLLTRAEIAYDLVQFTKAGADQPEFWTYYGDYDWVVLCQLYGPMIDKPTSWPMFAMDVKQLAVHLGNPRLPNQTSTQHNALEDARWTREAWEFLWMMRPLL